MQGNPILDLVFKPWTMQVLFAASRLRVFSLLSEHPMSAAELVRRTGADERLLTAILDACVPMGLLHREDRRYVNSHLSESYLVEGKPLYLGDIIEVLSIEGAAWQRLYDVVSQNTAATEALPHPQTAPRRFTLAMNNLAMQGEADALASAIDLSDSKTLVDVGCGSGAYSATLCLRNPNLRATLLDRPEVLETTREVIQSYALGDRLRTKPADMTTDSYGHDLDVVLLSDVLYQTKAACLTVLRSAYDALVPGGRLIVRGYYSDPGGSESLFGALFVVHLLLSDPSRDPIPAGELKLWVSQAGFNDIDVFALTERSTCLTAVK
ncbi:MAG: methyltransferase dimerization domain-containing protein [Phycisphaerae bacterium]|jgi:SAM-dependent methyltransferase